MLSEPLHARLKRETATAHGTLETFIAAANYFSTLPGYVTFLRASLAFHAEAEQALHDSGAAEIIPDWPRRHRAHLARHDLEWLGHSATAGDSCLTKCPTPEWVLGTAYVVEGSTLGGAVLLKSVAHLGLGPDRGAAFLSGYGPDRGNMWQAFLRILAQWERQDIDQSEVVRAARAAFEAAHRHFERIRDCGPARPLRSF